MHASALHTTEKIKNKEYGESNTSNQRYMTLLSEAKTNMVAHITEPVSFH